MSVIFTNVGEAHLEGFGTVDLIAEEKSKLLESAEQGVLVVAPKAVLDRSILKIIENLLWQLSKDHQKVITLIKMFMVMNGQSLISIQQMSRFFAVIKNIKYRLGV